MSPAEIDLDDEFTEEIFLYLDALRESGATNMFGAGAYLERDYGLDRRAAREFLTLWMKTFSDRHNG